MCLGEDEILDLGLLMAIGERVGVGCGIGERVIRTDSFLDTGDGGNRQRQLRVKVRGR